MSIKLPVKSVFVISALACLLVLGLSAFSTDTAIAGSPAVLNTPNSDFPSGLPDMDPWWQPAPGTTWEIQFSGKFKWKAKVEMYDIDMFEHDSSVVDMLHERGIVAVAYINAGAWEDWRPDADQYPQEVLGKSNGWKGERWLDIRQIDVIGPILEVRLDMAVEKGFNGVDFDNVDGYTNDTGFPLTAQDQLDFNIWLAEAAHARGLSVGLKNDIEQVAELEPYFDWAVNEQCFQYQECDWQDGGYLNFIDNGKAVFQIEYKMKPKKYCSQALEWQFSSIRKKMNLNQWSRPCK